MDKTIREKGALKFVAWGSVAVALGYGAYWLNMRTGHAPHGEFLVLFAAPGAYALVGLLEALSGRPFREFAVKWEQLKGWQRGVLGSAIAATALVMFMAIVVVAFS
jgi:hypothetical protein